MEREAQKTHGNPLRNKYRAKKGDFVMFADDDNWCVIRFSSCWSLRGVCALRQHPSAAMHMCESAHPQIMMLNASLTATS